MKKFLEKLIVISLLVIMITIASTSEYIFGKNNSKVLATSLTTNTSSDSEEIANAIYSQEEPNIFLILLSQTTVFVGELMENLLKEAMVNSSGTPTIDSIIFNEYLLTRIDYFRTNVSSGDSLTILLKSFVSKLYVTLVAIVAVIYIFMLVYVGVRIVMTSVADQQAKYKQMLSSWAIGLLLLFTFHYIMSYVIELNDITVNFIRTFSSSSDANKTITTLMDDLKKDGVETTYKKLTERGKTEVGNDSSMIEKIPQTSDYFTTYKSVNILKAVIWIALLSKTIIIAIIYIKRLIMITFLMLVFPFVTISYVLDRVKEGKSKIFDMWFKSFLTNVFINLLHAITFVVVVQMSLNAMDWGWGWFLPVVAILVFDKLADQVCSFLGISNDSSLASQMKTSVEISSNMIKGIKESFSKNGSNKEVELKNDLKFMNSASAYMQQGGYKSSLYSANDSENKSMRGDFTGTASGQSVANMTGATGLINSSTINSASVESNGLNAGSLNGVDTVTADGLNAVASLQKSLEMSSNISGNVNSTVSSLQDKQSVGGEKVYSESVKSGNIRSGNATSDTTITPSVNVTVKSAPKVDVASVISGIGVMNSHTNSKLSSKLGNTSKSKSSKSNNSDSREDNYEDEKEETSEDYIDAVLRNSGIDPDIFTKEEKEKMFNQQIESYKKKTKGKKSTLEKRKSKNNSSYKNINTNISDID